MQKLSRYQQLFFLSVALLFSPLAAQDSLQQAFEAQSFHTIRFITRDDWRYLPYRTLPELLALQPGIVLQDGELHARAGRAGQIAYFLDDVTATNPYFNTMNFRFIPEAVEEIQLHTGAYTAEFGGGSSALVHTQLRTGGNHFEATANYRTDDFAAPGGQFLKTTPFGFYNAVATLGGPLFSKARFFVAGQYYYFRDRDVRFLEPFRFDSLKTDVIDPRGQGHLLPGPVAFERNYVPDNFYRDGAAQGTLTYEMNDALAFRFTGSFADAQTTADAGWPFALQNIFNRRHALQKTKLFLANFRATHKLNAASQYDLALSYSSQSFQQTDKTFDDNWQLYADSLANAQAGYTGFRSRYFGPLPYYTIFGFRFSDPNTPFNNYFSNSQGNWGGAMNFTSQLSARWHVKIGGRYDAWTMRRFDVNTIANYSVFRYGFNGNTPRQFQNEMERRIQLDRAGAIDRFGYDVDGNTLDSGVEGARRPSFLSLYLQNRWEYQGAHIGFGIRYERIALDLLAPNDIYNPAFNPTYFYIDESQLTTSKPKNYFLPRFNLSYELSRSLLFLNYGLYVQAPPLQNLYTGNRILNRTVLRSGNEAVGFLAEPERAMHFELGVQQKIKPNFRLTAAFFWRESKNFIRKGGVYQPGSANPPTLLYRAFLNEDEANIKGLELTLELARTKRMTATLNYTYWDANGTEPDTSHDLVFLGLPPQLRRLNYSQEHHGAASLDYRYGQEGSKILQGLGFNAILSFNSGHPYTLFSEINSLGQYTPWNIGVYPFINPSAQPAEPINASTTAWNWKVDLRVNKIFHFSNWHAEIFGEVLNFFDTQNEINVFPITGTTQDDGWLTSPLASSFLGIPNYSAFYKAINLQNRWAYESVTTREDLFASPRQMRLGLAVSF